MDSSLKPDPLRKGSYYRRLNDVALGLQSLDSGCLPASTRFFIHYFGCEKIARGLVGVHTRLPATTAYHHRRPLKLAEIKSAAAALGLGLSEPDVDWIFADFNEQQLLRSTSPDWKNSARYLRNTVTHDFGPSNVARVAKHVPFLDPKMDAFLGCVPVIHAYLRLHFAGVP